MIEPFELPTSDAPLIADEVVAPCLDDLKSCIRRLLLAGEELLNQCPVFDYPKLELESDSYCSAKADVQTAIAEMYKLLAKI